MPYYAYDLLKVEQKKRITTQGWEKGIPRINRLLFRLVNKVQPATIIEVGKPSAASLYLQSAKPSAGYLFASDLSELFLDADTPVDFLYLNDYRKFLTSVPVGLLRIVCLSFMGSAIQRQ